MQCLLNLNKSSYNDGVGKVTYVVESNQVEDEAGQSTQDEHNTGRKQQSITPIEGELHTNSRSLEI